MDFRFSDDQRLLQATVRDMLAKECTPDAVRTAWASDDAMVPGLWTKLAELGVITVLAPEADGGLGLAMTDLVLLLEEGGRVALPGPVLEAAAAVAPFFPETGDAVSTVLVGTEQYAVGAGAAAFVVVAEGDTASLFPRDQVVVTEQRNADRGRRLASVRSRGEPLATRPAPLFDHAALGAAAFLVGLADAMITMTADYAREREQFGRPIGSFQAVKHHLADALLRIEFARPAVYRAAHSIATGDAHMRRDVSMAKVSASDAATLAARVSLQVHGAIGYTWEHDLHLWMKPAWQLAAMYGDAAWHRTRVARELGLTSRPRPTEGE